MNIECPHCNLSGPISDANIPDEGRTMVCPRCKGTFPVQKEALPSAAVTLADCPACGFSTFGGERFDICPRCGLVAEKYKGKARMPPPRSARAQEPAELDRTAMRLELERLEMEDAKRKRLRAGNDLLPLPGGEPVPETAGIQDLIRYVGWGVMLAGLIVLVWGLKDFFEYRQLVAAPPASETEAPPGGFMAYLRHGLLPSLQVLVGGCAVAAGQQFTLLRSWARRGVEAAAWGGIACVVGVKLSDLISWFGRSSGSASFLYYLVGIGDMLLMTVLWSAPLGVLVLFLRGEYVGEMFGD